MNHLKKLINDDLVKHGHNVAKLINEYRIGDKLSWPDLLFIFYHKSKKKFDNQLKELFDTIHNNDNLKI